MADTIRTLSALQTLLADNTTGQISPQDLRDMLVSCMGVYGHLYVTNGATAQAGISGTPAKLTCFASDGASNGLTVANALDRITVDSNSDGTYMVGFSLSVEDDIASGPHTYNFPIYKDGSTTVIEAQHTFETQNKVYSVSASGILTLAAAEYLEIYVSSADGTSVTVTEGSFWAHRLA